MRGSRPPTCASPGLGRLPLALAARRRRDLGLACHPRLADEASPLPSSKLAALVDLLSTLRETGRRALVFSQFTRLLGFAEPLLLGAGLRLLRLDRSTPTEESERLVRTFQAGEADVFLISLRAGGFSLTLTAADTVVHLDPWWNPAVEDQATDRTHRIGQHRPVTVVRLVAHGTVEEVVVALHARKRELAAAVLDGTGDASQIGTYEPPRAEQGERARGAGRRHRRGRGGRPSGDQQTGSVT